MKRKIISWLLALTMLTSIGTIAPIIVSANDISNVYSFLLYYHNSEVVEECLEIVGSPSYRIDNSTDFVLDDTIYVENECIIRAINDKGIAIKRVADNISLEEAFIGNTWEIACIGEPIQISDFSFYAEQGIEQIKEIGLKKGTYIFQAYEFGALESFPFRVIVGDGIYQQEVSVYLNDKKIEFDVPLVIENGRTLVPVRAVLEKMGLVVGWDEATSSVTASGNGDRISMKINEHHITVNGSQHYIDTAPKVIDGRTMIPIRLVVEWIGASVYWADEMQSVYINYDPGRRIILKNGDTENYCYNQDENTIYMRPYQYTFITIADQYGYPVYAPEDFVISSRYNRNYIEIDEYNTLSAKVEKGVEYLELKDKNERHWNSIQVYITDEYDYTGYRIKLRDDGVNSKAAQFEHCSGYDGMFENSSHIYIRPNQSVAVIGTDLYGEKISDSEMQNYKWVSKNEFCKIDQYGTLSGASKQGNGEIQLVDKKTDTIVCRTFVHNFDKSTHFILPFISNTEKEQTYCNLNENLLMRNMTCMNAEEGCKVSFDIYNDWMIPVQISIYDENNNRKACYITGSSWVDTGIIDGAISGFKGLPIFVDIATGNAWEGDYVVPNSDASQDHFYVTVPYGGYMAVEYPNIKNGVANEAMQATIVDMCLKVYLEALDLGGVVKSVTGDQKETILKCMSEEVLETLIETTTATEVDMVVENLKNVLRDDDMQKTWEKVLAEAAPNIAGDMLKNAVEKALVEWAGIGPAYEIFMNSANVAQMSIEAKQMIQARNLDDPTIYLFLAPTKR